MRARRDVTHSALAVGVGLLAAAGAAAAASLPAADAIRLIGLSFGVAIFAYWLGRAALRRSSSPVIVALIPITSFGLGALAAAQSMFVSTHDLSALVVVVAGAGTAGVLGALALARELEAAGRRADEAAARERALERSRRQLVAWVSHDLRTPLAGIRAMVEALDDGVVSDLTDVHEYHGRLVEETAKLAQLVDDLFELSRIEADALDLTLERVSLGEVVSDAVASARALAAVKGVSVEGQVAERPPLVSASTRELTRVVQNLLDNAIRHTPPGGEVRVLVGHEREHAELSVLDGCGGIPPQDIDHVFDLAYRGDAARTPGSGAGAGLGLAIARGFVEAHRGAIAVRNEGDGCRFTVRLPLG
ncbi:MAG: sensor histidine kinase [Actinomycetota bacterium]